MCKTVFGGVSPAQMIPSSEGGLAVDLKDPKMVSVKAGKRYSATIREPGPGISPLLSSNM
jgi:hypothetical protein